MNRKSKIIVSVVGITIVLLALLGITYAYYLTRIEGNTNTNSISVTTADLRLVYGDGNGIITKNDIMPGTTIGEKTFTVKNTGKTKIDDYAVTLEYTYFEDVIPSIFERPNDFEITLTCSLTKKDGTTGTCNGFTGTFNNENIIMTTNQIESEETHSYSLTIYYANPNEDQSNDMGKNLNLIVDIIRLSETADINGEITGVDESYSVRLNSDPKVSAVIKNAETKYVYNFKGVPLGVHTLSVIDKDGELVSSHKLVIESGEEAKTGTKEITYVEEGTNVTATVPSITIKEEKRVANITTSVNTTSSTVTTTGSSIADCEYYPKASELLMDAIINNAKANKNGTTYSPTPLTTPAVDISGEDERTLSITQDNMGTGTSYYFRGSVQDNYVLFNNMCFRIVRIEGDGSVKLIFAGNVTSGATTCNELGTTTGFVEGEEYDSVSEQTSYGILYVPYGYDSDGLADYENYEGGLKDTIENWYTEKFNTKTLQDKLKNDKWCLGASENFKYDNDGNLLADEDIENQYRYSSGNRVWNLKTTSLLCENEDYVESKYGTLTVDEVMLAGGANSTNESYYLNENAKTYSWWTLSYSYVCDSFGGGFTIDWGGRLSDECISDSYITESGVVRPAITLIPGTTIIPGGEGTKTNPYVIN